jgi:phosphoglycolate phosphatase-like HAD superfamily hydrolase
MALRQMSSILPRVYVGDAAQDVEMAQRAGVRAIGVLGPFPRKTAPPSRNFY